MACRSRLSASATSSKLRCDGGVSRLTTMWAIRPTTVAGMVGFSQNFACLGMNITASDTAGVVIRAASAPC